ncbi:MAG: PGF-pre-PGF domain-containing protein [Methanocorpusculum sp.]|nr:PGF-pre-PGF domain-containing protein [Methanocorpusculum sp.]
MAYSILSKINTASPPKRVSLWAESFFIKIIIAAAFLILFFTLITSPADAELSADNSADTSHTAVMVFTDWHTTGGSTKMINEVKSMAAKHTKVIVCFNGDSETNVMSWGSSKPKATENSVKKWRDNGEYVTQFMYLTDKLLGINNVYVVAGLGNHELGFNRRGDTPETKYLYDYINHFETNTSKVNNIVSSLGTRFFIVNTELPWADDILMRSLYDTNSVPYLNRSVTIENITFMSILGPEVLDEEYSKYHKGSYYIDGTFSNPLTSIINNLNTSVRKITDNLSDGSSMVLLIHGSFKNASTNDYLEKLNLGDQAYIFTGHTHAKGFKNTGTSNPLVSNHIIRAQYQPNPFGKGVAAVYANLSGVWYDAVNQVEKNGINENPSDDDSGELISFDDEHVYMDITKPVDKTSFDEKRDIYVTGYFENDEGAADIFVSLYKYNDSAPLGFDEEPVRVVQSNVSYNGETSDNNVNWTLVTEFVNSSDGIISTEAFNGTDKILVNNSQNYYVTQILGIYDNKSEPYSQDLTAGKYAIVAEVLNKTTGIFTDFVHYNEIDVEQEHVFFLSRDITINAAISPVEDDDDDIPPEKPVSGGYIIYERSVENGGEVTFGSSPNVESVTLPEGTKGQVILELKTDVTAPEDKTTYMIFEINIPQYPDGEEADVNFRVSVNDLDKLKAAPQDICLYHFDGTNWQALPTKYTVGSDGFVYYTAVATEFSPFAIVLEKNAAVSDEKTAVATQTPTAEPTTATVTATSVTTTAPVIPSAAAATQAATASPMSFVGFVLGAAACVCILRRR